VIVVEFPPPCEALTLNQRLHWTKRANLTAAWRKAAWVAALNGRSTTWDRDGQSVVTVHIPVKDRRRRDPANWAPTCKAAIDGLTDAGWLWPDDDQAHVLTTEPVLVVGAKTVRIEVTPR
jgi:crossover junction endodeoxyribonuclease RusA